MTPAPEANSIVCVMAAYAGPERAAPILLQMLRAQQGLAGGYYTGVATVSGGRLHHEKAVGDVDALVAQTAAEDLPGTIGIAHSRSPSGGGREWSHPFVDCTGDLAYIANGAEGQYRGLTDLPALGDRLRAGGHRFRSAQAETVARYPRLAAGDCVHLSDIACHAIEDELRGRVEDADGSADGLAGRLLDAACACFARYPGEITGICLHAAEPDALVAVRHNKPLELGRGADGAVVLASSATAFGAGVERVVGVPPESGVVAWRDGSFRIQPLRGDLIPVGSLSRAAGAYAAIAQAVRAGGECSVADLLQSAAQSWPAGVLAQSETVVFTALTELRDEGKVALNDRPVAAGGGVGPRTWASWTGPR